MSLSIAYLGEKECKVLATTCDVGQSCLYPHDTTFRKVSGATWFYWSNQYWDFEVRMMT